MLAVTAEGLDITAVAVISVFELAVVFDKAKSVKITYPSVAAGSVDD